MGYRSVSWIGGIRLYYIERTLETVYLGKRTQAAKGRGSITPQLCLTVYLGISQNKVDSRNKVKA